MAKQTTREFKAAIGRRLAELRGDWEITQEQLAAQARALGLPWKRGTVAAVEGGKRELTAAELLLLPIALRSTRQEGVGRARLFLRDMFPVEGMVLIGNQPWPTAAFRDLASGGPAEIASSASSPQRKSVEILGVPATATARANPPEVEAYGLAEMSSARKLGVRPQVIDRAALSLWKRSLTAERDARADERAGVGVSIRTRQALKGHITRELLVELEAALKGTQDDRETTQS